LLDVDIVSVVARTEDGNVRDTFLLRKNESEQLDEETMQRIKEGLLKFL